MQGNMMRELDEAVALVEGEHFKCSVHGAVPLCHACRNAPWPCATHRVLDALRDLRAKLAVAEHDAAEWSTIANHTADLLAVAEKEAADRKESEGLLEAQLRAAEKQRDEIETRFWDAVEPWRIRAEQAEAALVAAKQDGANWMLDSIRAALSVYPLTGCDVVVAQHVDRIVSESIAAANERAEKFEKTLREISKRDCECEKSGRRNSCAACAACLAVEALRSTPVVDEEQPALRPAAPEPKRWGLSGNVKILPDAAPDPTPSAGDRPVAAVGVPAVGSEQPDLPLGHVYYGVCDSGSPCGEWAGGGSICGQPEAAHRRQPDHEFVARHAPGNSPEYYTLCADCGEDHRR